MPLKAGMVGQPLDLDRAGPVALEHDEHRRSAVGHQPHDAAVPWQSTTRPRLGVNASRVHDSQKRIDAPTELPAPVVQRVVES
jgi:hypothetical protein